MATERPEVRYYEWESGDSAGTVFDIDEVFDAFFYADERGLSVRELFQLLDFPEKRYFAKTETYALPEPPEAGDMSRSDGLGA